MPQIMRLVDIHPVDVDRCPSPTAGFGGDLLARAKKNCWPQALFFFLALTLWIAASLDDWRVCPLAVALAASRCAKVTVGRYVCRYSQWHFFPRSEQDWHRSGEKQRPKRERKNWREVQRGLIRKSRERAKREEVKRVCQNCWSETGETFFVRMAHTIPVHVNIFRRYETEQWKWAKNLGKSLEI